MHFQIKSGCLISLLTLFYYTAGTFIKMSIVSTMIKKSIPNFPSRDPSIKQHKEKEGSKRSYLHPFQFGLPILCWNYPLASC